MSTIGGETPENGVDGVLTTTRTVRRRYDFERPVPLDVVHQCLDLALQAPTGGDFQGWRWIVVTDPATKLAMRDLYHQSHVEAAAGAPADRTRDDPMMAGAWYLAEHLHQVPVLVVACIKGRLSAEATLADLGALFASIYPAVWGFQLALRSRGLASAMTTVHLRRHREMAALLGIPDNVVQAALVPVGYLRQGDLHRARRRPVADVAYAERWGDPISAPGGSSRSRS